MTALTRLLFTKSAGEPLLGYQKQPFALLLQRLGQPHVGHVALYPPARSCAFHVCPRLLPATYYVARCVGPRSEPIAGSIAARGAAGSARGTPTTTVRRFGYSSRILRCIPKRALFELRFRVLPSIMAASDCGHSQIQALASSKPIVVRNAVRPVRESAEHSCVALEMAEHGRGAA